MSLISEQASNDHTVWSTMSPIRVALLLPESSLDSKIDSFTIERVVINATHNSIASALDEALPLVQSGKLVQLSTTDQLSLYLIDGLTCAQLKLHPHAYLSGLSQDNNKSVAIKNALVHAKRQPKQVYFTELNDSELENFNSKITSFQNEFSALIQAVECISRRTRIGDKLTNIKIEDAYSHVEDSQYWFMPSHQPRIVCLSLPCQHSSWASLVLVQGSGLLPAKSLLSEQQMMFIIQGQHRTDILIELEKLEQQLKHSNGQSLLALMHQSLSEYDSTAKLALVLQGKSTEQLLQELRLFKEKLVREQDTDWRLITPSGSCFHSSPNSKGKNGLTFVYPGVGTAYSNMLMPLHQYFPNLFEELDREVNLADVLQSDVYYSPANSTDTNQQATLIQQAISGVGASFLFTRLLQTQFDIKPELALGYSMGEATMWASLGVWHKPQQLFQATAKSDVFNNQISGELLAVRQLWQINSQQPIHWNSFIVRVRAEEIIPLLNDFPRAYLAISQGDSVIVSGCEKSCRALLAKLGKRGIASNKVTAMHTPAAKTVFPQLETLYHCPLQPALSVEKTDIKFISAASSAPITGHHIKSQTIATSIATTYTQPLNFADVIYSSIDQGSRIFLELGADRQTSTIIDKITAKHGLKPMLHTLAIDSKGQSSATSLLKCLAQLISLRVPLSVSPLVSTLSSLLAISKKTSKVTSQNTISEDEKSNTKESLSAAQS